MEEVGSIADIQRIVGVWNSLDAEVVKCKTVNSFKSKVDKWLRFHG